MKALFRFASIVALAALASCGDDDHGPTDVPTDTGDADAADTPDGSTPSALYETCPAECASTPTCARDEILTCCACVKPPAAADTLGRTPCGVMSDYCDEAPPDPVNVACLKPDGWPDPPPDSPPTVTIRGVVDVYGSGNTAAGGDITVEFYRMAADGTPDGSPIGTYSATLAACRDDLLPVVREDGDEAACCPGPCQELLPDADGCTPTSGDCRALWYYEIADVPTYAPLILHTSGDPTLGLWKDMYYSNVFFFPEDVEDGADYVFYRAKTLSVDDWRAIPATAGDFDGIARGQGAVAGEIHDCDNVKLYNATVGVNPVTRSTTFTYFNGVEAKPYPDTLRTTTNSDGLYAALEIPPGSVRVTAVGRVAGEGLVNLGWWDAHVFPDALTVVTIRGTRPTQVPAP
jgi:hypothetical protein